jgi:lysophospholipase L1-like esterase
MRIMPLGDSITDGYNVPGGYRIELEDELSASGIGFDLVGSLQNGPPSLADRDHEGHSGWKIDEIDASVGGWIATYQPDVVLLLIGTNDILRDYQVASAPDRLSALVGRIHTLRPTSRILLSTIPPLADATENAEVAAYNAAISQIARTEVASGRLLWFVDGGGALAVADLADGIHPNAAGYDKLADKWYAALVTARRPPTISSFSPAGGPVRTTVRITGSGFIGARSVKFGRLPGRFTIGSASRIIATVPRGAKDGKITVTTPAGTASSSRSFHATTR